MLLVVVMECEAYEDGWVLSIPLSHKDQTLHHLPRCKIFEAGQYMPFSKERLSQETLNVAKAKARLKSMVLMLTVDRSKSNQTTRLPSRGACAQNATIVSFRLS